MKKYLVEFIGTFFLMFTILCALFVANVGIVAPIAIGMMLAVMVYAGGAISGGHYNPAVSLGATIRGALEKKQILPYWIAQTIGALAAAFIVKYCLINTTELKIVTFNMSGLLIAEFLLTFALVYVVLSVATNPDTAGNSFFGISIGGTVMVGAFVVGGISLAAFNPAVVFGLFVLGIIPMKIACATIAANIVAGICAALTFKYIISK